MANSDSKRRGRRLGCLATLIAVAALLPASASAAPQPKPAYVPGQVIVGFHDGTSSSDRHAARAAVSADEKRAIPRVGAQLVQLPAGASVQAAASELRSQPGVSYAEPNWIAYGGAAPNDPEFSGQWALHNTGQTVLGTAGTPGADIHAPEAWDLTTGSSNAIVAIVDSGIDYNHPDLAPNMWTNPGETGGGRETNGLDDDHDGFVDDWRGWDFVENDNDPRGGITHGTFVGGIAGARGNDGYGMAGVSWHPRLMNIRVLNNDERFGEGLTTEFEAASGMQYAVTHGAQIVNVSISTSGSAPQQLERDVIANSPNTLFVTIPGNDGADVEASPRDPCSITAANLICVTASTQTDQLGSFSPHGTTSVDLAAPGEKITSASNAKNVLVENFSTPLAGRWVTGGSNNTWGRTTEAPFGGTDSLTDSPGGDYANNTDSFAQTSPALNFSGLDTCRAIYHANVDTESPFDTFTVSAIGATTTTLETLSGSGTNWFEDFLPDSYSGQTAVALRLGLHTDSSVTGDGVHIDHFNVVCRRSTFDSNAFGNGFGTSYAAPQVAGAAALLMSYKPTATVAQLRAALLGGVDHPAALAGTSVTGGRLNARRSLEILEAAPQVSTGGADGLTPTSATLHATVDSLGDATSYRFQFGTSSAYGFTHSALSLPAGFGGRGVSFTPSPLTPGTTYHYRILAQSPGGTSVGEDRTFTTPTTATPPTPGKPVTVTAARLGAHSATLTRNLLRVDVRNPNFETVTGSVTLARKRAKLGSARFRLAGLAHRRVTVKVSRAGLRLIRRRGHVTLRATIVIQAPGAAGVKTQATLVARAPRSRRG